METPYQYLVQNRDKNESISSIEKLTNDQDNLLVTNIFQTIQGEMPYAGTPALFLRLAGCNRGDKVSTNCGFCDTSFATEDATNIIVDEVMQRIMELKTFGTRLLVITGGEPFLQYKNLAKLAHVLDVKYTANNFAINHIQFETNGDRIREIEAFFEKLSELSRLIEYSDDDAGPIKISIVISPKGVLTAAKIDSLNQMAKRLKQKYKKSLKIYLRRLVSAKDAAYALTPHTTNCLRQIRDSFYFEGIYVSPITEYRYSGPISQYQDSKLVETIPQTIVVDPEKTRLNLKAAMELCLAHGLKLSTQNHLEWGIE
jgi:organic radical activating enzyme